MLSVSEITFYFEGPILNLNIIINIVLQIEWTHNICDICDILYYQILHENHVHFIIIIIIIIIIISCWSLGSWWLFCPC